MSRLNDKQLLQIQGPIIPVILNRMGYERSLAHCLVFGPCRLKGLGVIHIRTSMALSQLSLFIHTLRTTGLPQRLTMNNLHRIQHLAGVGLPYLNHRAAAYLDTPSLHLISIEHLNTDSGYFAPAHLQRKHDFFLMDIAIASPLFNKLEFWYINYCRLYLQVLLRSNICTACRNRSQQVSSVACCRTIRAHPG